MAPVHCFVSITVGSVPSSARTCAETGRSVQLITWVKTTLLAVYFLPFLKKQQDKVTLVMMSWWWRISLWRSSSSYPSAASGLMFGASSSLKSSKVSCCFRVNRFFGCISSTTRSAQKNRLSAITNVSGMVKLADYKQISERISQDWPNTVGLCFTVTLLGGHLSFDGWKCEYPLSGSVTDDQRFNRKVLLYVWGPFHTERHRQSYDITKDIALI